MSFVFSILNLCNIDFHVPPHKMTVFHCYKLIFHHDKAKKQSYKDAVTKFKELGYELVPHPPNFSNLANLVSKFEEMVQRKEILPTNCQPTTRHESILNVLLLFHNNAIIII